MREYSNGEIVVCWDPSKCIHARECVKGLPQVFNRDRKPWVNMQGASSEEIMSVIDRCPSGALSYKKVEDAGQPAARIKVVKNGPLLVEGRCSLVDQDGKKQPVRGHMPSVGAQAPGISPSAMGRTSGSGSTTANDSEPRTQKAQTEFFIFSASHATVAS